MNYIILDTNIFIHFRKFTEIDWEKVTGNKDENLIVILPMVIDELDKHKYHKDERISRRVKKILPEIERLSNTDKPTVKLISNRPNNCTFQENHLEKSDSDDNILASILEFQKELKVSDNLVFITNDTGPRLKSESLGIPCMKMDEEYLLALEPSVLEIENRSLKKELEKYRTRFPKISLSFNNGHQYLTSERNKAVGREQFISSSMKDIKEKFKEIKYKQKKKEANNIYELTKLLSSSELSEEQVKNYNEKLQKFFQNYHKYFSSLYSYFDYLNNCIEVNLKIINNGTAPAEDIDIDLHFPNGFKLHTSKGLPKVTQKPSPPYKPKNRFDFGPDFGIPFPSISPSYRPPVSGLDLNSPTIEETNSYNVNFHLTKLKHHQSFELETLYLKFDNLDSAKNFSIEYSITIGNLPDSIEGQLNVIIK